MSRNGIPCQLKTERGFGPDCGGTVLNNKSLYVAIEEMDNQIKDYVSDQELSYKVGSPPWEGSTKPYVDKHGLTSLIEKLNHKERGK